MFDTPISFGSHWGPSVPAVAPLPQAIVALDAPSKNEGNGTVTWTGTITLDAPAPAGGSSGSWSVAGIGANQLEASDFAGSVFPSGSWSIAEGATSTTFNYQTVGDTTVEPDETGRVSIGSPVGCTILVGAVDFTLLNDDVSTFETTAAVEANGWVLAVTGNWSATPGAWEFAQESTINRFLSGGVNQFPLDPVGTPKIVLEVQTAGYDRVGGQAVANANRTMLVVATQALRRPSPNPTQLDETDNGDGTRTIRFALSKRIPAGATIVQASFLTNWKQGRAGGTILSVPNASTRSVIPVISRWAGPTFLPVFGTSGSPNHTARVEVIVAAEHPEHFGIVRNQAIAAMKLVAYDGTNTKEFWFTGLQTSPVYGDNLRCWGGTIDLSGLNPGVITIHRTVYPWIGSLRSTGSSHNTSNTGSFSATHDTPLHVNYDPTGTRHGNRRRYVFVHTGSSLVAAGDVGSVVLHTDIDSARAAATSTKPGNIGLAMLAMKNLLIADASLAPPAANGFSGTTRACDYWEIILTDGQTHTVGMGLSGTPGLSPREGYLIVRGDPAAATPRVTTIFSAATAYLVQNYRWWFKDLRITLGGANLFDGSPAGGGIMENVTITGRAGYESSTNGLYGSSGSYVNHILNCNSFACGSQPGGLLVRNMQRTRTLGAGGAAINVTINDESGTIRTGSAVNFANDTWDCMAWNFRAYNWPGGMFSSSAVSGSFGATNTLQRIALVNFLIEGQAGDAAQQLGEYFYSDMQDSIWEGVGIYGSRINWHNETRPWSYTGTTVYAGVKDHGLSAGDTITVAGFVNTGDGQYSRLNGTYTVASVLSPHRFSYVVPVAVATGGNTDVYDWGGATVTRASDSVVLPVVRWPGGVQHIGLCLRNCSFDRNATKQDRWISDGTQTGSWELLYGVGQEVVFRANRGVSSPGNWQYAYPGLKSESDTLYGYESPSTPAYINYFGVVDEATNLGSNLKHGDYRPSAALSSRLIGKASIACTDEDILGVARGDTFAAGAFEATT